MLCFCRKRHNIPSLSYWRGVISAECHDISPEPNTNSFRYSLPLDQPLYEAIFSTSKCPDFSVMRTYFMVWRWERPRPACAAEMVTRSKRLESIIYFRWGSVPVLLVVSFQLPLMALDGDVASIGIDIWSSTIKTTSAFKLKQKKYIQAQTPWRGSWL
jgi:hypothetical protein